MLTNFKPLIFNINNFNFLIKEIVNYINYNN